MSHYGRSYLTLAAPLLLVAACASNNAKTGDDASPNDAGGHPAPDVTDARVLPAPDATPARDAPETADGYCAATANLAVASTSTTAIKLSWMGAPGVTIQVSRETYCGTDDYVTLATLPAGATSYVDDAVQAQYVYWYRITATDFATGMTASAAIATQADSMPTNACSGGAPPRSSGVSAGACSSADGGNPTMPDSGGTTRDGSDGGGSGGTGVGPCPAGSVSVKASGATGNGTTDDTAALQSAVNAAPSGSTLCFPAGSYLTSKAVNLIGNVTYFGENAAASIGPGASSTVFTTDASATGLTLEGLTLNGGGLVLGDNTDGTVVDHCTIENISDLNAHGIFCGVSNNLHITNNLFQHLQAPATSDNPDDYSGLTSVMPYNSNGLVISGNTFSHFGEGAHIIWSSPNSDNQANIVGPVISNNVATGQMRMFMEIQTACTNCTVHNTVVKNNQVSHPDVAYWATFGISAAIGGSVGTLIENNTLSADNPNITAFMGYGIEQDGTDFQILNNTIEGPWGGSQCAIIVAYYPNYSVGTISGNTICGDGSSPLANEGSGGAWTQPGETSTSNTVNASCPAGF